METENPNNSNPPAAEDAPVPQILPRCPHCKVDPMKVLKFTVASGTEKLVMFFCGNPECRCVLGTNISPLQPTIVPGTVIPRPRLV